VVSVWQEFSPQDSCVSSCIADVSIRAKFVAIYNIHSSYVQYTIYNICAIYNVQYTIYMCNIQYTCAIYNIQYTIYILLVL
jgi:hypothetical protein